MTSGYKSKTTGQRRCHSLNKEGCATYKDESEFKAGKRILETGEAVTIWSGWCHTCRRARSVVTERNKRKRQKEEAIERDKVEDGLFELYFSRVPVPAFSVQLRAERLGL